VQCPATIFIGAAGTAFIAFSSEEQAGLTVQHNSSLGNESYWAEDVKIFRWPLIDGKNNDTLRASEVLGAKKYS
jgi:hypothetical protein